ncbi:arginine ABC transporter substrate-binding protein [Endozoicomonas sp. (ex Bugula neritina AB1)]|nr:arginine ABC transporter substrate-binding protein [Endozoicomonas sp. (ex Bugula neritina AB1)]
MKKLLIALTMTLAITQAHGTDTISFGMEATYPPFEFMDENNELTGFDVELANAICAELNTTCEFNNQPFDSLIPSLKFRRFDAVISAMDITSERLKQVDFTDPYIENSAIFVAATSEKLTGIEQLKGKKVGVQNGSTHQSYLIEKLEKQGVTLRPYDSYQNALLDMTNGRIDVVFADTAVANEWISTQPENKYTLVGNEIKDADYFGIGMGIATRKSDELTHKLNKALATVKQNGTYDKLVAKYFN